MTDEDVLLVACPRCSAKVGKACRPKRERERNAKFHACRARRKLALNKRYGKFGLTAKQVREP